MKYGFIGCGNMGGAIARALANTTNDIMIGAVHHLCCPYPRGSILRPDLPGSQASDDASGAGSLAALSAGA